MAEPAGEKPKAEVEPPAEKPKAEVEPPAEKPRAEVVIGTYTVDTYKHLGQGSYGVVYLATDSQGKKVAAKMISGKDNRKMEKITMNLDKLKRLKHPNIVNVLDVHQVEEKIWIFMEYCSRGDLANFFKERELDQTQKLQLMLQMARGVEYLHSVNVIHRDIKPANILISNDDPLTLKLTDFDCSKFLEDDYDTSMMSTNVGTRKFKAVEFFQRTKQGLRYHRNVDTYSTGLTYLAMIQHKSKSQSLVPHIETHNDDSELSESIGTLIAERVKYGTRPLEIMSVAAYEAAETTVRQVRDLIRWMTNILPEKRPTAEEVVRNLQLIAEGGTLDKVAALVAGVSFVSKFLMFKLFF